MSSKDRVKVAGSERAPAKGSRRIAAASPEERVQVTVLLRPGQEGQLQASVESMSGQPSPDHSYMTREEFEIAHGATEEDVKKVEEFARGHSLEVVQVSKARRTVILAGTVKQVSTAFGVRLARYRSREGTFRGRVGPITLPADIAPIVRAVLGLDNRPQARPHFRNTKKKAGGTYYTPPQLAKLYNFPQGANGSGQCIAIIELGGGFQTKDLKAYFSGLGVPLPTVTAISVDGGSNTPTGNPNGPDGEVMLDIEVAGAIAPGAQVVVYFAPNTDSGFLDAITSAVHDNLHRPSVVSISWGSAESNWTQQALQAFNQAFAAAAALGVTVSCAAGDGGSSDGETDGLAHVDFPASAPYALACGGTRLGSKQNTITSEVVWNDMPRGGSTGGGVSEGFPLPPYQTAANVPPSVNPGNRPGRGVPDVSGDADPNTGYLIRVDGRQMVIGGTSAVAPLWAALIALTNQSVSKALGFINPLLYNVANAGTLRDIVSGNNGAYSAGPGWDPCTGLGSPKANLPS